VGAGLLAQRQQVRVQVGRTVGQHQMEDVQVPHEATQALVKMLRKVDVHEQGEQLERHILVVVRHQQDHRAHRRQRLQVPNHGVLPRKRTQQPAQGQLGRRLAKDAVHARPRHILPHTSLGECVRARVHACAPVAPCQ
jgi:hypothetical protein